MSNGQMELIIIIIIMGLTKSQRVTVWIGNFSQKIHSFPSGHGYKIEVTMAI